MKKNFTIKRILMHSFLLTSFFLLLAFLNSTVFAQGFCSREVVIFSENFGTGTTASSNQDIITSSLTYQATGSLTAEGVYRVINNTQQKPEWHNSPDHTGNGNGKMLVINGNGNSFYSHTANSSLGFTAGFYSASLFFMNVNPPTLCSGNLLLPVISFILEYQAADNSWVAFSGSPVTTASVPASATPVWVQLGGVFILPTTGNFIVKNIRLTLNDGLRGGCGNDYALDDIKMATCPEGGPLPVEFSNVSARQKGAGIAIEWSTASEINNKYFEVEKSIDGGSNWGLVATIKSSGSSSVTKKYNAYDVKPVAGLNYYRIKQVDFDGKFKYSATVYVKVNIDKTSASVLTNPFINDIAIDILSKANQHLSLTLIDATGKIVSTERWAITKGSSRRTFDKVKNIQKGIYVLQIVDENGTSIYNGKLVKQ